ncbi:MAG TPA: protein kinase [Kofleriaceae bacterium]|nr:protein kinase [Kofleriaceae bacterium]
MRLNEHAGAAAPMVVGRYRIQERLAAGGFGAIYLALDLVTGTPVALKVLHAHLVDDRSIVERFVREAEMLRELRGPQAVTIFGSGVTAEGAPYLAMELLAGETLHARFMARGRLPWREVVVITRGVCAALAEPHALGIVHRDLKPANIFLEARGVRVLDYGIAKRVEPDRADGDLTRQGELLGTLEYMAPEQLVGSGAAPTADLFTLGVVMYEMIAGVRPFGDPDSTLGMLGVLLGSEPAPLATHASVPGTLARVIERCLSRDPERRFATVGQLDAALALVDDSRAHELDDAEDMATTSLASIETEDTWIGALPTPALAPPRTRFAQGTSDDGSPYTPRGPLNAATVAPSGSGTNIVLTATQSTATARSETGSRSARTDPRSTPPSHAESDSNIVRTATESTTTARCGTGLNIVTESDSNIARTESRSTPARRVKRSNIVRTESRSDTPAQAKGADVSPVAFAPTIAAPSATAPTRVSAAAPKVKHWQVALGIAALVLGATATFYVVGW